MREISVKLNKEHVIQKYYLILFLIDPAIVDIKRRSMLVVIINMLCARIKIFFCEKKIMILRLEILSIWLVGLVAKSTPWTAACLAPLSMEFSRQEYWGGLSFPSPRDLPDLNQTWIP